MQTTQGPSGRYATQFYRCVESCLCLTLPFECSGPLLASHWHWQYWVSADICELKLFRWWSFQLDLADECCVQLSSMSGCYKLSKGCKYSRLKPYQATNTALKGRMCLPWPKSIYTDRQSFWCLTGVWTLILVPRVFTEVNWEDNCF